MAQAANVEVNVSLSCVFGCPMEGDVAEAEVTASIAVSTAMALVTLPVVMYLVARFVAV